MAVGEAQGDGFFRAKRGVVQAPEKAVNSGRVRATASSSTLTWAGLAATVGLRAADDRSTCQPKLSSGLSGSSPASAA
ncbi:MAG TPA: hypothetical protein VH589_18005 [Trebonia sp.]